MDYYPFPALLISEYNTIHEYGQALVGPQGSIDFIGDFVPLIPLGTAATVEWVLGDKSLATFKGGVYLSSPQLLRLVDVDAAQLAAARHVFAVNTRLPAGITAKAPGRSQPQPRIPCEILYMDMSILKLRVATGYEPGTPLWLSANIDFLTLRDLSLRVVERVPLHRDETLLLCEVQRTNQENFIALSTYAARLAAQEPAGN